MGNAVAGPLSVAGPVLSVVSGVMKGEGDQAAADYQSQKLKVAAEYAHTSAKQTDVQMRENLNTQLSNIDAVRAASGIDPSSPTTAAIRAKTEMIGDRSRSIQVGNIMAQADQDERDANYYQQAGSYAYGMDILGGVTGAANSLAKTKQG